MKIVFMGTPDFAVKTLEALLDSRHEVAAVFCQPDKPIGRKQILTPPPVKIAALDNNITVYQPKTLRDGEAYKILKEINPDIIVVVAYGKILPVEILKLPKYGCVNGHASLLPRHRGASPIQWAIVSGDKKTGVTTMCMDEGMDTGDMLLLSETNIGDNETADELFERLSVIGAKLMLETLEKLESGILIPIKQPQDGVSYAPIIKKEMALLDFSKTAEELNNLIKGFYSWPCAYFYFDGKRIKVIKASVSEKTSELPKTVISGENRFIIACGNNTSIELIQLQPEGSKPMTAKQMLCGKKILAGTVLD